MEIDVFHFAKPVLLKFGICYNSLNDLRLFVIGQLECWEECTKCGKTDLRDGRLSSVL